MHKNYIYLYGIAGADKQYRVIRYTYIDDERVSIDTIKMYASWLKINYSAIEHVYAIDNRPGLGASYREAIRKDSIESMVVFKDILEREGIRVI